MSVEATPVPSAPESTLEESKVFEAARDEVGAGSDVSSELGVTDDQLRSAIRPLVKDLNRLFGTSGGLKEVIFTATAQTQDYLVTAIASDISEIQEVLRSSMYLADSQLGGTDDTDVMNRPVDNSLIPVGYQPDAMNSIKGVWRFEHLDQFSWEIAYPSGAKVLRLMPVPTTSDEIVSVRYTTTGASFDTLPDEAEEALHYACCYKLLDLMLNRISSQKIFLTAREAEQDPQARTMAKQRDRYESMYRAAKTRVQGSA